MLLVVGMKGLLRFVYTENQRVLLQRWHDDGADHSMKPEKLYTSPLEMKHGALRICFNQNASSSCVAGIK